MIALIFAVNPFPGSNTNALEERRVAVDGGQVHYYTIGSKKQKPIVLLHGAAFNADTWKDLGTLKALSDAGFYVVAVNLPGYKQTDSLKSGSSRDEFLGKLIDALDLTKPVVISPSFSGSYSIPYLIMHPDKLGGYIPVAPVIPLSYKAEAFKAVKVPTLIIYGENDGGASYANNLLKNIPDSKIKVIPGGSHPAYRDNPTLFHQLVIDFLKSNKH